MVFEWTIGIIHRRRPVGKPRIVMSTSLGWKVFKRSVEKMGLEVWGENPKLSSDGGMRSRTDPFIHRSIAEFGDKGCDVLILVSGDSDFQPMLEHVKKFRRR